MVEKVEYVLFHSENERDLKLEYPELAEIEDFKNLNSNEVRLCWMIGNTTSPIHNLSKKDKVRKAIETIYGRSKIESSVELKRFYEYKRGDSDIPDRILKGIARMLLFNPENRIRAKLISQYMFDIMNQIVVVSQEDLALMDMDDKKKYAELMIKVNSELPKMIETLESGFGVKLLSKKTGKIVKVNINKLDS